MDMTKAERARIARLRGLEEAANTLLRLRPEYCGCRCEETPDQAQQHENNQPWEHHIECKAWWGAQERAAVGLLMQAGWARESAEQYVENYS